MREPDWSRSFAGMFRELPSGEALRVPRHERRGWRISMPRHSASSALGVWLMHCPVVHMAWDYWVASLAHLRPQSDVPPARILAVEGSAAVPQHELLIFAVSRDTQPDPDNLLPSCTLLGPPLSFQFGSCGEDDAEAVALVQWIVEAVVNGHMSPDDDARSAWRMLLDGGRPQWLRRQATPDDPDTD